MITVYTRRFTSRLAKATLPLIIFFIYGTGKLLAQSRATWNLRTTNTPVVCGPITAAVAIAGSSVANVTSANATSGFSGTGFPTTIVAANYSNTSANYFEYAITNTSAVAQIFTGINISTHYAGPSPIFFMYLAVRTSVDNFATSNLFNFGVYINPGSTNITGTTNVTVAPGATLKYRVYGYFSDGSTYRFGNTLFSVSSAPSAPGTFTATAVSNTQIALNATANAAGNNIMLVSNNVNTFGTPATGTGYVAGNTIPGGGTVLYIGPAGSPFFNHTGLLQGTTYFYQLFSISPSCNLYSTVLTANATTLCPTSTLNLVEGFNTASPASFPSCWTQQFVTGSSTLTFETTTNNPVTNPQEGTRFVSWNSYNITSGSQTRLVSPRINTSGTPSVNAQFYWYHDNSAYTGATYATEGIILQWSTDRVTWTNVSTVPRVLTSKNGWTVYDITLPGAGNNASVYVGFLFKSVFGNNCSLDNILIYPTPTCNIPNTPLTASAIGLNVATIAWSAALPAPSLGYEYYISPSPIAPSSGTIPTGTVAGTTANLTGLVSNTVYYFWVRAKCSAADKSAWVGAGTFETVSLYCTSTSTNPGAFYINKVSFVGTLLDVTNSSGFAGSGYQNFTGLSPKSIQAQGQGMNVYVQSNFSVLIKAWVDWNNSGVFDATELVYSTNGTIASATTFGFVVPALAVPGDYPIRIRTTNTGASTYGPCGSLPNGETEDYLFTVVASCGSLITAVGDGETCGPGPVILSASATPGTTQFRWYSAATGGVPLATTPTGIWTTPSIGVTTIYYITAYDDGCESLVRTAVSAKVSAIPVLSFTPTSPVVCGEGAVLSLNASGDNEEGILINENFSSGLGSFFVSNISITPPSSTIAAQWQPRTSTYVPANTTVWRPAISSGFGTNNFAFATSDLTLTMVNTALVSPTVNSTGYTTLGLSFDLFYSHYLPDGDNSIIDSVIVEVATNTAGTNWTRVAFYVTDQGIGTRFKNNSIALNAYINITTLKVRFRYYGNWTDGVAIDNIKLSGLKPLTSSFSWSPLGGGNLFTDATGSTPYTGGPVPNVFIKPTAAQISAGTPLNFTATATLSNGCSASTPVVVVIGPSQWTGATSTDWHDINNWCSKTVPAATTIVEIPASMPRYPVISASANAATIKLLLGASLTITSTGSLAVAGKFDNQGSLTNNGKIILDGSGSTAQTFPGATGVITAMNSVEINNSGSGVILDKSIFIERELKPTAGNLALGNFDITIKSVGALTGAVGTVGSSAGFSFGTGRFVIERYIPTGVTHGKSWQLLATPANGQTIKASWMEGAAAPNANPVPNYGTQIAGVPGTAGGFDATALFPVMKYYSPATNNWVEAGNPNTTQIFNDQGYFIFVRGNRSVINFSGANSAPLPTTLRTRGTIQVGPVSGPIVTAGLFQSVGNPYPSAIDYSTITRTGGVDPNFYLFDPTLYGSQGVGGYQTITAATGYLATPGNLATTSTIYNTTSSYKEIQSGQAFLVRATGTNGTLNFAESNKVTGSTLANRGEERRENLSMLTTNLLKVDGFNVKLADGNRVVFSKIYRNIVDGDDALKIFNSADNFGISREGKILVVEARRRIKNTDTIFYNLSGVHAGAYRLMFVPENIHAPDREAYLADNFLNTRFPISLRDTGYLNIDITADPASAQPGRFMLVFTSSFKELPMAFIHVSAIQNSDNSTYVAWEVEGASDISEYVIERSSDGLHFYGILETRPDALQSYSRTVGNPLKGANLYRIRAAGIDGKQYFSKIVKTNEGSTQESISVSPNPVSGRDIRILFAEASSGKYHLQLTDKYGQVVNSSNMFIDGLKPAKTLSINRVVSAGVYQLKLTGPGGKVTYRQVVLL